ncbi:MAG: hypothetical protein LBO66_14860, partial [Deltaproteobacteria bacterium]|nr:hypothetical protein [Deltaproteobacteria bacterium]
MPLFTFLGVREGIVGSLTQKFLDNPRNLEIGPAMGVWRFNRAFFAEFLAHPDVTFVVPETASISASVLLSKKGFSDVNAVIVATGEGDPILPRDASGNPPHNLGFTDVFVTQELADSLNLSVGDQVMGRKTRDKGGVEETLRLEFTVRGVVSIDYVAGSVIFTSLELMEEIDGFRAPMNLPTVAPPRDPDGLLDDSPAPVAANDPLMDESLLPTAEEELSTEETIFPTAEDSPLTEE